MLDSSKIGVLGDRHARLGRDQQRDVSGKLTCAALVHEVPERASGAGREHRDPHAPLGLLVHPLQDHTSSPSRSKHGAADAAQRSDRGPLGSNTVPPTPLKRTPKRDSVNMRRGA